MRVLGHVLRALEHHVLEEVREPGAAGGLVGGAHVVPEVHGHHRQPAFLAEDHFEPVRQRDLLERELRNVGGRRVCVLGCEAESTRASDDEQRDRKRSGGWMFMALQASPQIPARNRTIRTPGFADLVQPIRRRRLAQAVGLLHGLDDAQVAHRQHVGPVQPEHQEHLRRPAADALHLGQRDDHLVVAHRLERVQRQRAVVHPGAEVAHVAQLLAAQSDRTQLGVAQARQRQRRRHAVEQRHQPQVDRPRRLRGQLLRHDGLEERAERLGVLRLGEAALAVRAHQIAQHRVAPREVPAGSRVVGGHQGVGSQRSYFKLKVTVTCARTSI